MLHQMVWTLHHKEQELTGKLWTRAGGRGGGKITDFGLSKIMDDDSATPDGMDLHHKEQELTGKLWFRVGGGVVVL